jgi:hypothetical protein
VSTHEDASIHLSHKPVEFPKSQIVYSPGHASGGASRAIPGRVKISADVLDGQARDTIEIDEVFTLKMLGDTNERCVACEVVKLAGRRLVVKVSGYISSDTGIRIDCDDSFLLGEVLACWREGPGSEIFAAIELRQAMPRLTELARLRAKFSGATYPLDLVVRQSA